jgi:hypothetical protein
MNIRSGFRVRRVLDFVAKYCEFEKFGEEALREIILERKAERRISCF